MKKQKKQVLAAIWYVAALAIGFVFSEQILGVFG